MAGLKKNLNPMTEYISMQKLIQDRFYTVQKISKLSPDAGLNWHVRVPTSLQIQ